MERSSRSCVETVFTIAGVATLVVIGCGAPPSESEYMFIARPTASPTLVAMLPTPGERPIYGAEVVTNPQGTPVGYRMEELPNSQMLPLVPPVYHPTPTQMP